MLFRVGVRLFDDTYFDHKVFDTTRGWTYIANVITGVLTGGIRLLQISRSASAQVGTLVTAAAYKSWSFLASVIVGAVASASKLTQILRTASTYIGGNVSATRILAINTLSL